MKEASSEACLEDQACTFDEALIKHIGQFGRGQRRVVGLTSLFQVLNALAFMLWVFVCMNPVSSRSWECTDPEDTACSAAWVTSSKEAFCSLPTASWRWTNQGTIKACHPHSNHSSHAVLSGQSVNCRRA